MAKKDIHPKYYSNSKIKCACGAKFTIGSTKEKMEIEICSQCHPLYTGKQKFIDSAGRMERYEKIMSKSEKLKKQVVDRKKGKNNKKEKKENGE